MTVNIFVIYGINFNVIEIKIGRCIDIIQIITFKLSYNINTVDS